MKVSATAFLIAVLSLHTTSVAAKSAPFSPVRDPGIYPGGNENPEDGWKVLPEIDGARIDNSTIVAGQGSGTLLNYIDADYDPSRIKRAVIQIHGENRDAWNQWIYADLAAKRGATGGSFSRDEVVVMAPMFFNTKDSGAYPFDPSLDSGETSVVTQVTEQTPTARRRSVQPTGVAGYHKSGMVRRGTHRIPLQKDSTTEVMIWKSIEWGDGSPAYEPANAEGAGSFDALDAAIAFFLDQSRFPNLRKVVVAGFSLGGQLAGRYATLRSDTSEDNRIIYWVSSPNSFVYMQGSRPAPIGDICTSTYSHYKYGLNGTLPNYVTASGNRPSNSAIISRFLSRTIYYLVGMQDLGAGLDSCAPNSQGSGHLEKMYYWTQQVVPMLPGSTGKTGQLPGKGLVRFVKNTGHQDWKIITSDPGVETLMLKQWYSNGTDAHTPQSNGVTAGSTPSKSQLKNAATGGRASVPAQMVYAAAALSVVASVVSLTC